MAGGGQAAEVTAVGQRRQAAMAHVGGGSLTQRPKTGNGIAGVRRQLATQATESVSSSTSQVVIIDAIMRVS